MIVTGGARHGFDAHNIFEQFFGGGGGGGGFRFNFGGGGMGGGRQKVSRTFIQTNNLN